uniref:(northern house mosquito) hypothetical protein n=1 Tax=Culex pipiens TaxID=7175 RepID=A0A8D7ZZA9_CULPI
MSCRDGTRWPGDPPAGYLLRQALAPSSGSDAPRLFTITHSAATNIPRRFMTDLPPGDQATKPHKCQIFVPPTDRVHVTASWKSCRRISALNLSRIQRCRKTDSFVSSEVCFLVLSSCGLRVLFSSMVSLTSGSDFDAIVEFASRPAEQTWTV